MRKMLKGPFNHGENRFVDGLSNKLAQEKKLAETAARINARAASNAVGISPISTVLRRPQK